MSDVAFAASAAAAIAGAGVDLRTGRIPNLLTAATATTGLALAATGVTGTSLVAGSAGRVTPELQPSNAANVFVFALP